MRKILNIIILLTLIQTVKAQMLYYQNTYKGGASFDGVTYATMDYLQADTIHFQNSVPAGCLLKKALLFSWKFTCDNNRPFFPVNDIPMLFNYNGNTIQFDSSNNATPLFTAINTSNHYGYCYIAVRDVTSLTQNSNNILSTPNQSFAASNCQSYNYDSFFLLLLYENNGYNPVNVALYLNNQNSVLPNMAYSLNNLSPINTSNDVGLSIESVGVSFSPYLQYQLNSTIGSYNLDTLRQVNLTGGNYKTGAGSFHYENNTLFGLVDDSPNAFIDTTDALANIKTYLPNNANTFTLIADRGTLPVYHEDANFTTAFVLAYSTPCPARTNDIDTIISMPCGGNNIQLNNTNPSVGSYTWSASNNSLNNNTIPSPIASPTTTTTYIALVDSMGCKHTEQFRVNVLHATPKTDSVQTTPAICGSTQGTATIIAPVGSPNSYTVNGAAQSSPAFTNLAAGTYTFALSDAFGCTYTSPKPFVIKDTNLAKAVFYPNPSTGCAPLTVSCQNLSNNTSNVTNNWVWYANGDSTITQNFNYTFLDTGKYTITLLAYETYRQCSDTISYTIHVTYCPPDSFSLTVPNIFTPNNDTKNDTWQVSIYNYQYTLNNFECTIYDRWGKKVFSTNDINQSWSGKDETAGTYFYMINYQATGNSKGTVKEESLKGFIELIL